MGHRQSIGQRLRLAATGVSPARATGRLPTLLPGIGGVAAGALLAAHRVRSRFRAEYEALEQQAHAMRRHDQRLREAQRLAHLGYFEWDIDTHELWWSEEAYRIYGYEPGEIVPTLDVLMQLVHPDDRATLQVAIDGATREGTPYSFDHRIVRPDGEVRVLNRQAEVTVDENGAPLHIIGTFRDVTEEKRIEEELHRTRASMVAGQEIAHLGTWEWQIPTDEVWWSDEVDRIFGFPVGEVTPSFDRFLTSVHPDDREHVLAAIQASLSGQEPYSVEIRIVRPDGALRTIQVRGDSFYDPNGTPVRMNGAVQDITDRKRAEQELAIARDQAVEASRLKSEFLATMSHEIRTPMNGVLGMLDLLLDTPLDRQQRDFAATARDSARSLMTIINDILDFSRIEAGKLLLETVDFDITTAVEGSTEVLAARAREKDLSLMTYVAPEIPSALRGDPGRLRQVLVNLVGNAVKFTERGEVTVRATLDDLTPAHAVVRFTVEDTGVGLTPDARQRLFQPFIQADASTTRKYGGTGLGLAISRRLVELMDGEIGVRSVAGQGSTFWFTARLERAPTSLPAAPPRAIDLGGLRVLVADDRATNREIVHSYIVSWGMRNGSVGSAEEALALMRRAAAAGEPYDVAIVDLVMPGMDGFALAQAVQADPTTGSPRMILLTAFDERGRGERALSAGFSAYLTKPVRRSQLFDAIATAADDHRGDTSPLADDAAHNPATAVAAAEPAGTDGQTVLLAEDNPVNQKVAKLHLERLGYRVEVADTGRKVVEAVAAGDGYGLILMDVQMPEMDGFAATRAIRRAEIRTGRHLPIVAMTANAMEGDRELCLAAGMDDYLSKPVTRERLREVLERWMTEPAHDHAGRPDPSRAP